MFGYRLIPTNELEQLRTDNRNLQARHTALLEEIGTLKGQLGTKATMADMLTTRVNVLELEAAQVRHQKTGLPAVAPQIGRPSAVESAALSAGVDLFEDVGDVEAERLGKAGLLHDSPVLDLPSARNLVESVGG